MADIDVDRVEKLLNLADLVREYPTLKPISELVHRELVELNKEAEKVVEEIRKKEAEEKEAEEAKKAAEAKEKADAERHSEGVRAGESQTSGSQGDVRRRYPG